MPWLWLWYALERSHAAGTVLPACLYHGSPRLHRSRSLRSFICESATSHARCVCIFAGHPSRCVTQKGVHPSVDKAGPYFWKSELAPDKLAICLLIRSDDDVGRNPSPWASHSSAAAPLPRASCRRMQLPVRETSDGRQSGMAQQAETSRTRSVCKLGLLQVETLGVDDDHTHTACTVL